MLESKYVPNNFLKCCDIDTGIRDEKVDAGACAYAGRTGKSFEIDRGCGADA